MSRTPPKQRTPEKLIKSKLGLETLVRLANLPNFIVDRNEAEALAHRQVIFKDMRVLPVVQLLPAELSALLEYSTTIPTGTTLGKKWKRHACDSSRLRLGCRDPHCPNWVLGEYVPSENPLMVGISWKRIVVEGVTKEFTRDAPPLKRAQPSRPSWNPETD